MYVHFSLILSYYKHLITKYTAFALSAGTELVMVEIMKKYSQILLLITTTYVTPCIQHLIICGTN
jgi:hypothetical protein